MTTIVRYDLVGLTRDVNPDLPEGPVGMVKRCNEDDFEI